METMNSFSDARAVSGRSMAVTAELCDLALREMRLGHLPLARGFFEQARDRVLRAGWEGLLPSICVVGSALVSAEGDHERSALLAGVVDAVFRDSGQTPDPGEAREIAGVRDAAVGALGAERFAGQFDRGRELDPPSALYGV